MSKPRSIQAPKGMRDYYPAEMLRRRYVEKAWRDTAIRCGFDEIDGPTFEHTDLYTVKSGEAILGEIFGVFSGKDEEQVKAAAAGRTQFALRPEFTPTLARMYAARAAQLPKPAKWFMSGPFFRAERPQRGRLREFLQWNVDFIGGDDPASADAETISCCIDLLASLGLASTDVRVGINDRRLVADILSQVEVPSDRHAAAMTILDRADRFSPDDAAAAAAQQGITRDFVSRYRDAAARFLNLRAVRATMGDRLAAMPGLAAMVQLHDMLEETGHAAWLKVDPLIVRGLAYYTGMVFEVHEASGAERAIAGGGRYDNLIELFGGPPTPAVGFGMGDVVLSLVLEDRGLMPQGAALLDRLSEPPAGLRPDAFIISNGTPEADAQVRPLMMALRRGAAIGAGGTGGAGGAGGSAARPLHARVSYKATKNIGKLLKEAADACARFAVILESGDEATLKNLGAGSQVKVALREVASHIAGR